MNARTLRRLTYIALIALVLATALLAAPAANAQSDQPSVQTAPTAQACTYTVRYGDTLYSIAARYHTTVWELMRLNHLYYWWIYAGQTLVVPCGTDGGSGDNGCTYRASFVADITVPDGSTIVAGSHFNKIWRVRNTGTCTWGPGHALHSLVWVGGTQLGAPATVNFNTVVLPGREVDLTVPFVAPTLDGRYLSEWKLKVDGGGQIGVGWSNSPIYVDFFVKTYNVPTVTRIQFAPGTTSQILNGIAKNGQVIRYVAGARAGQTMDLQLLGIVPTPAVLSVVGADGTVLLPSYLGRTSFSVTLPRTQDYFINVEPTVGNPVEFALQVTIE